MSNVEQNCLSFTGVNPSKNRAAVAHKRSRRKLGWMKGYDRVERRAADRVADSSLLVVNGFDRAGRVFQERARIKDVSTGGISFLIETSIEPGVVLHLSFCAELGGNESQLKFETKARVLRVCFDKETGSCLVAARFEGDVVNLTPDRAFDALVRELEQAVAYDESRRQQV
jgi:hypothetical protein